MIFVRRGYFLAIKKQEEYYLNIMSTTKKVLVGISIIVGIFILNALLINIGRNKCTFNVDFDGMGSSYCPPNKLRDLEDRFRYWLRRTIIIPLDRS